LTFSARSGNLIAGDGTKDGLSRSEQKTVSTTQNNCLTGKSISLCGRILLLGRFSLTGIDAVSSPNGRLSEGRVARDIGDYMTFREIFLLISAATGGVM
jgi:hypothetical protein